MRRLYRPVCPNPTALRSNYKYPDNKEALKAASNGKCMYCESHVSHLYYGDVEHIRPKDDDKFPELKFDWENLGYACARCNNAKNNKFESDCPLIDPYFEEPSTHLFAFGALIKHKRGSERGALTIITVDLNRAELIERREIRLTELQNAIDACYRTSSPTVQEVLLNALDRESAPNKEFSMFAGALLAAHR